MRSTQQRNLPLLCGSRRMPPEVPRRRVSASSRFQDEAMVHGSRVDVESGDSTRIVDALGNGALARTWAGARGRERGKLAGGASHEAVIGASRICVGSRDVPGCVGAVGVSADAAAET